MKLRILGKEDYDFVNEVLKPITSLHNITMGNAKKMILFYLDL